MPLNNFMQLAAAMQRGADPRQIFMQLAQQDPRVGQALQMIQGKSPQELRNMAENLAKERGIDFGSFMQQFGMK